jgi:hypothetical protein
MVTVIFERLISGRRWTAIFDMGSNDANSAAILREAWNTRSRIVEVVNG